MNLTGNTIFITGGGSGIGRRLAEELHKRGNQVIISGRRRGHLDEVTTANPGMASVELDIQDPASIASVAAHLISEYPKLNVLVNNAGIMKMDDVSGAVDEDLLISTVTTNLFGPIRMTSALIEHLKSQESATVVNVSSGLAFVPLAIDAVYSSTKAALHSYSLSLRYKLAGTSVKVVEIIPPWVATELQGPTNDPRAMPLEEYISETMQLLGQDSHEILVEGVKMLRNGAGPGDVDFSVKFNDMVLGAH